MTQEMELSSLANLGHGAAIERFDDEMERALQNIMDINTTEDVREVRLIVKLKPNEERTACAVAVACTSKLAPGRPFGTTLFPTMDGEKAVAIEHNPQQMQLPGVKPEKLHKLEGGRG